MNKVELILAIKEAFADVHLDDGIGLMQAQAIDDYASEESQLKARLADEKADWQQINSAALQNNNSSLAFFDAAGMRFHLPAYMLAHLQGEIDEWCIFHLTDLSDYARARLKLLDQPQRLVCIEYLRWYQGHSIDHSEQELIDRVIRDYWQALL